jgi:hypothetical protein
MAVEPPRTNHLPQWRQEQLSALATFSHSFDGPNWPNQGFNWLDVFTPECEWFSSAYAELGNDGQIIELLETDSNYLNSTCDNAGVFQQLILRELRLTYSRQRSLTT